MGLGIVKTSWTTVILPPYSSSIILGYLIYRKSFTHSDKQWKEDMIKKLETVYDTDKWDIGMVGR